ncbi:MAG: YaeQ family protein [Proteobacteria bacterium]|nr:YaeQ family protein [Pseudomonadota bacterium]
MALKATIFKAELQIADMDRNYYQDHALTIARHPSETDERMMVRLLAFALNAGDALNFGKGLSTDDEPDLWQKDLTGAIELWIDVGLPDEKRIRRACGRAQQVLVYIYGGHGAAIWWDQNGDRLERNRSLAVVSVPVAASQALAKLAKRTMQLNCTIQDGQVWLGDAEDRVQVDLTPVKAASGGMNARN